jgi:hypothetical protein
VKCRIKKKEKNGGVNVHFQLSSTGNVQPCLFPEAHTMNLLNCCPFLEKNFFSFVNLYHVMKKQQQAKKNNVNKKKKNNKLHSTTK